MEHEPDQFVATLAGTGLNEGYAEEESIILGGVSPLAGYTALITSRGDHEPEEGTKVILDGCFEGVVRSSHRQTNGDISIIADMKRYEGEGE